MWLKSSFVLVLVLTVAVTGQKSCSLNVDLHQDWSEFSFVVPSVTECSYQVEAPYGHRIKVSCEPFLKRDEDKLLPPLSLTPPGSNLFNCDDYAAAYSVTENEVFIQASDFNCVKGSILKESEANNLNLTIRAASDDRRKKIYCTLSLIKPDCSCGRKNHDVARIVNGYDAAPNEFPMMAALVRDAAKTPFCGATIISDHYALTAAHCLDNEFMALLVGSHDLTDVEPYRKYYSITSPISHPGYTDDPVTNDIGLVRTVWPIQFNAGVGPVCLPWKFRGFNFQEYTVEAAGWGALNYLGYQSIILKKVDLEVIDNASCSAQWRKNKITSEQMCTYTRNRDTCQGDSGGPLFLSEPDTQRLYLVGIVSYGYGCGRNIASINTRVTEHLNWIEENTRDSRLCKI